MGRKQGEQPVKALEIFTAIGRTPRNVTFKRAISDEEPHRILLARLLNRLAARGSRWT